MGFERNGRCYTWFGVSMLAESLAYMYFLEFVMCSSWIGLAMVSVHATILVVIDSIDCNILFVDES